MGPGSKGTVTSAKLVVTAFRTEMWSGERLTDAQVRRLTLQVLKASCARMKIFLRVRMRNRQTEACLLRLNGYVRDLLTFRVGKHLPFQSASQHALVALVAVEPDVTMLTPIVVEELATLF